MLKILTNGYSKEKNLVIQEALKMQYMELEVLSSGDQAKKVKNIIKESEKNYVEIGTPICMFVEFREEDINKVLKLWPKSIIRPLFCILTESNSEWNLDYLGNHLIEERREMQEKMKEKK